MSVGAGGGLLAAVRSGRVCRLCSLWAAWSSVRRGGGRNIRVLCPALPGYFPAFPRGGCRQHPARAGLLIRQAGQAGRQRKRKGQGGGAWCAAALAFCLHWRFDLLRRVRPGAGGGADLLAVPVGMVSAGTVPAVSVPASRLALAVLHPGRFLPFAGGVRFST